MHIYVKTVRYKYSSKRSAKCEVGSIAMPVYNQTSQAEKATLPMETKERSPRRKASLLPKAMDKRSKKKAGIGNAVQKSKRLQQGLDQGLGHQPGSLAREKRKKRMGLVTQTSPFIFNNSYGEVLTVHEKTE